jgi:predicted nucleotidyltransferase
MSCSQAPARRRRGQPDELVAALVQERLELSAALDRPSVVSALLFGSQATGKAGPLSDVDLAVWLDRDPRTRIKLEADAVLEYLDTAPLRETLAAGIRHRIAEGRFGRP